MIIGHGMIAKAFEEYDADDVIIFASGVSRSFETDSQQFYREEQLLREVIENTGGRRLIYFSTCSIYDSSVNRTPYVQHKLKMESIIQDTVEAFHIFRLPQIVGKATSPTLVKVLFDKINNNKQFELWIDSYRNLIDIEHVVKVVCHIIRNKIFGNQIVNLSAPDNISVPQIVKIIEEVLNKKADYVPVKKGVNYRFDMAQCKEICVCLGILFDKDYIKRTIEKYYMDRIKKDKISFGARKKRRIIASSNGIKAEQYGREPVSLVSTQGKCVKSEQDILTIEDQ